MRAALVTRPDANTRRLHPQALAEARLPRGAVLDQVVRNLGAEVAQARRRGLKTVLYLVYAGHGNVERGRGYISLEDRRLTSGRIQRDLIERLGADQTHLIVDACYSYFLAQSRGPGGQRRTLDAGFSRLKQTFSDESVGLLLSTSRARSSHEWEGFQAGVFSHEVRSGLRGAADADMDGLVSYREIGAFVARANAAIPNERFRPEIFARPPSSGSVLLDIRRGGGMLQVGRKQAGRYLLEDSRGVRLADFHSTRERSLRLLLPRGRGPLYLRRLPDRREYTIPAHGKQIVLAGLSPRPPRASPRGAAHDAFQLLFAWPFGQQVVDAFAFAPPTTLEADHADDRRSRSRWLTIVRWGGLALSGASLVGALTLTLRASSLADGDRPDLPHDEAAAINDRIRGHSIGAAVLYGLAGVATAASVVAWLWPEDEPPSVVAAPSGAGLSLTGWF